MATPSLEARLRAALAHTSEAERPLSSLELPLGLDQVLLAPIMNSLRPAAVLVPVVQRGAKLSVLFTRRAERLRSHSGQISFPGGRRDEGDANAVANALREAEEEVGLPPASSEVIGYLDDYPTITRYRVTPVVALVRDPPPFKLAEDEVAEAFEVPLVYVLNAANYERKALSRNGMNIPFFELHHSGHRIWGATAGMLWNLVQKYEPAAA